MNADIWVPVKVLPGKEALEFFNQKWRESGAQPFNGEYQLPLTKDSSRLMTTELDFISHCITDIDMNSYNPDKQTVMMRCRFCGPKGSEALEKYIDGDLRFGARTVVGKDKDTGEIKERIVTFDAITRPEDNVEDELRHAKELKKERALKAARDKKHK